MIVDGLKPYLTIDSQLIVFKLPLDNKLHIFDERLFRDDKMAFYTCFDNVEKLCEYYGIDYLLVTQSEKKGIYIEEKGLVIPCIYDDIKNEENIIILTKNNKKTFLNKDNISLKSIECDEIIIDKVEERIIYCKENGVISIYYLLYKNQKLIPQKFHCDELNYANYFPYYNNTSVFIFKKIINLVLLKYVIRTMIID